jgi:hypothetical protein
VFKLFPGKYHSDKEEDRTSHNSTSSMSSQNTNDETSDHQIITHSSNDSNSESNEETSGKYVGPIQPESGAKLIDICVDCYQMMEGVSVSIQGSTHFGETTKTQ